MMRIALSCCLLLHLALLHGVRCQTSGIVIGESNHPIILNRTIDIPAETRPWYKSVLGFFTRAEKPVQNINYTFPSTYVRNTSSCLITGIDVNDINPFGKGGLVRISDGGVRQDHVTFNFVSKPGESMQFYLKIYGYCVKNDRFESNLNAVENVNPINYQEPVASVVKPSYGWAIPLNATSNATLTNSTSVGIQNATSPSNSNEWWHFW